MQEVWKQSLMQPTATINDAIKILAQSGARIVLVVKHDDVLLGTVTDGDIRRAIIKGIQFDSRVSEIMNKNPTTATKSTKKDSLIALMRKYDVLHVPLLENKKIIDLVSLVELYDENRSQQHSNYVFIMAGGFGTRLQPLTNDMPKPLLNIGDQPILLNILKNFKSHGFRKFIISTHYQSEKIMHFLGDGSKWDVEISYIHEKIPLGTAGAIGLLPKDKITEPFIMMNGDILTKVDFNQLLKFHTQQENKATICVREYDMEVPYGVVKVDDWVVTKIVEKPVHKFFVNAGIYVLDPGLINFISPNVPHNMPKFLQERMDENMNVSVFPIHEYWLDVGQHSDFEKAHLDYKNYFEKPLVL